MTSTEITIDKHSIERYRKRDMESDQLEVHCNSSIKKSPSRARAVEALGYYKFTWGIICEQLVGTYFVVWLFRINSPADHNDKAYKSYVFEHLEDLYPDYASEQVIFAAGLYDTWCIFPGTGNETFSVAATLQVEQEARDWIAENILRKTIADILPPRNPL